MARNTQDDKSASTPAGVDNASSPRKRGKPINHIESLSEADEMAAYRFMVRLIKSDTADEKILMDNAKKLYDDKKIRRYSGDYDWNLFKNIDYNSYNFKIYRIFTVLKNKKWTDNILPKVFFLLFMKHYGIDFQKMREEVAEEMNTSEEFVIASSDLFYGTKILNRSFAELLKGRYKLYRPSPYRPDDEVAICEFSIGEGGNGKFQVNFISSIKKSKDGLPKTHTTEGKVVLPDQSAKRFHAVTVNKSGDYFFFSVDSMDLESDGYDSLGGVMISSFGTDSASSWPFFAKRLADSEEFSPTEISYNEAILPQGARNRFIRGWIDWEPERFLKSKSRIK